MKYGREQEKKYNKNFRFTLTTNGLLINEMCIRDRSATGYGKPHSAQRKAKSRPRSSPSKKSCRIRLTRREDVYKRQVMHWFIISLISRISHCFGSSKV